MARDEYGRIIDEFGRTISPSAIRQGQGFISRGFNYTPGLGFTTPGTNTQPFVTPPDARIPFTAENNPYAGATGMTNVGGMGGAYSPMLRQAAQSRAAFPTMPGSASTLQSAQTPTGLRPFRPEPIVPGGQVPSGQPSLPPGVTRQQGSFAGGWNPPEQETYTAFTAPQQSTLDIFNTIRGMSGADRQSYLTSMQQNLTQRLQQYQTLQARGFGGEMDETARRDYEATTKSLQDITRLINDPSYLDEMMRMHAAQSGRTMQAGQRYNVPWRTGDPRTI